MIDVKQHPRFEYGAYTAPGVKIRSGQFLEEYLGDLRPPGHLHSFYCFEIPGVGVVDAEEAGKWTRFVNSHCRPNVTVWGDSVGKRHVVVFQATRDIQPEEEIVWNYGPKYFEKAEFKCGCSAKKSPHWPSN